MKNRWTAKRVKALRLALGDKPLEFSWRVRTGQATTYSWESGRRQPRGATVALLDCLEKEVGVAAVEMELAKLLAEAAPAGEAGAAASP